jgi:hypothetical protein
MTLLTIKKTWSRLLPFFAFFILVFVLTSRLPFFWDKDILYSRIAHYLLDHHFPLALPNDLDTGYPPALAYLLALAWKLTGKSLFTAHLIMLPFTLGIVWQTRKLIDRLFGGRHVVATLILIFADTVLLSQTVVFSTDLVMLFFMILAINAVLDHRRVVLAFAVAGLLFSHMRGLSLAAAIAVFDLIAVPGRKPLPQLIRMSVPYIPAISLFAAWMVWHYRHTGWFLMHAASPWAGCYEWVDSKGFLRNIVILGWRMIDFGRILVWLIPLRVVFRFNLSKLGHDPVIRLLVILLAAILLFTLPAMLFYKILNGHRYLIPFYFLLSLLASYLLFINPGFGRSRRMILAAVVAGLISGSFWVYPQKIATGWDATLAHLPYHHLRRSMIRYLDEAGIPIDSVGSHTPNLAAIRYIELIPDDRAFPKADLTQHRYIFYSNVFNMFTDAEIDALQQHWTVAQEYRCLQVRVVLYRKPG